MVFSHTAHHRFRRVGGEEPELVKKEKPVPAPEEPKKQELSIAV